MGFERLTPINSLHENDSELSGPIDAFVIGLGEWIDALQDAHAGGHFGTVAERAGEHAERAAVLGYPGLAEAARDVVRAADGGEDEAARKAISDLIEIVQRIRLGHRSAA